MPAKQAAVIEIIPPDIRHLVVTIRGVTPLLCSNAEAALPGLEDIGLPPRQPTPRPPRNPERDFQESRWLRADGLDGFPATGIKRALRDAGVRNLAGIGTRIVATVQLDATDPLGRLLIDYPPSSPAFMHRAYVRHGGRTADIAYRACFPIWGIRVPVSYNAGVIASEHIVSLFDLAGFSVGLGAWRPERNGTYGRFVVEKVEVEDHEE